MRLVVVGAGITGAACACTAAALGAEVVLADAGLPGQATAAGAGIICPWPSDGRDAATYALACTAAAQYPGLIASLAAAGAGDVSYRQAGALVVTADEDDARREGQRLRACQAAAPEIGDIDVLAAGRARDLFPPLRDDAAAVRIGGAARVDGRAITAALTEAARRAGAQVRMDLPGRAVLHRRGGRVAGVVADGDLIEADAVVAAAGAWTGLLAAPAGITVRVAPQRGQIVHLALHGADTSGWPVVLPAASGHYLLAFDDSRVVAGATREAGSGFDARVTAGGLREVLAEALTVAPGLASATHLETRAGLRPAGPDGRPLLGPVRSMPGLVVATGLGAEGLTIGPLAGRLAAQAALGLDTDLDLAPFDPIR